MKSSIQKKYFFLIVEAVVSKIITVIPFLGYPVINQLFTRSVMKIAELVYEQLRIVGINLSVDFRTDQQRKDYDEAMTKLEIVLNSPSQTLEEIENAKQEYRKKLRDLIRINTN